VILNCLLTPQFFKISKKENLSDIIEHHLSPEAAEGGPIAIVEDGDLIAIDIPNRKLELQISDDELQKRLKEWIPPKKKIRRGYLARYALLANSADKGAYLQDKL
jgi:dihydroxy-acid dehydratase